MMRANIIDSFSVGRNTANAGTAFAVMVPPYSGAKGGARKLFSVDTGQTINGYTGFPNWWGPNDAFAHITDYNGIHSSTSHTVRVMRPLNWTYFVNSIAKNTTAIGNSDLKDDPGAYSTNYRYQNPQASYLPGVANNTIASGDYVAYQLADGTWRLDTIASGTFGSSLTLTTGTPNVTGGGVILAGSPLFFFGASTDTDPATGAAHLGWDETVSTTQMLQTAAGSLWHTLHRGDPICIYNANGTGATVLAGVWGVYTKDW